MPYCLCGEVLGNYYEADPDTFYCAMAEDESGFRSRWKHPYTNFKKFFKEEL